LVGWDRRPSVNSYDMHPVVRHELRKGLDKDRLRLICNLIHDYLKRLPKTELNAVTKVSDLVNEIESYRSLIGLERHEGGITESCGWRSEKGGVLLVNYQPTNLPPRQWSTPPWTSLLPQPLSCHRPRTTIL
jgi:hypothetical protein